MASQKSQIGNQTGNQTTKKLKQTLLLMASLVGMVVSFSLAVMAGEDDDLFQSHQTNLAVDKSRQRSYVGSRDEQRLEVQAALPQPSRNPDGSSVVVEEADEPATTPDTD